MNKHKLAYIFLFAAIVIALDLYVRYDGFQLGDIHHETWIVTFGFAGLLLLWLDRRGGKHA